MTILCCVVCGFQESIPYAASEFFCRRIRLVVVWMELGATNSELRAGLIPIEWLCNGSGTNFKFGACGQCSEKHFGRNHMRFPQQQRSVDCLWSVPPGPWFENPSTSALQTDWLVEWVAVGRPERWCMYIYIWVFWHSSAKSESVGQYQLIYLCLCLGSLHMFAYQKIISIQLGWFYLPGSLHVTRVYRKHNFGISIIMFQIRPVIKPTK